MAKPSISVPEELLDEFDSQVDEMRRSGEMDLDTSRSEVIQELMRLWLEGNLTLPSTESGAMETQATAD
ncbi:MAG: CopG family ribbon-helix-helix protein [archaeon]